MGLSAGEGLEVFSSGSNNISGFDGDNGTVGVGNESGKSIGIVSNGVDGSSGLGMGNLGSVNLGGISGNDGTVDMSDKSTWGIGVWVDSMSEVGSLSSSNSWGVSRDDSSVGVGDKGLGRADGDESSENLQDRKLNYFFSNPYISSCL